MIVLYVLAFAFGMCALMAMLVGLFIGMRLLARPGTVREEWEDIKRELRWAE